MKNKPTFWITNISKTNVSLSDLNITVRAGSSVNLLDNRHYSFELSQLEKSHREGSIYRNRKKIRKREGAPEIINLTIPLNTETFIPSREKSIYVIEEKHYEELTSSVEDFAKENADLSELDAQKISILKDK